MKYGKGLFCLDLLRLQYQFSMHYHKHQVISLFELKNRYDFRRVQHVHMVEELHNENWNVQNKPQCTFLHYEKKLCPFAIARRPSAHLWIVLFNLLWYIASNAAVCCGTKQTNTNRFYSLGWVRRDSRTMTIYEVSTCIVRSGDTGPIGQSKIGPLYTENTMLVRIFAKYTAMRRNEFNTMSFRVTRSPL